MKHPSSLRSLIRYGVVGLTSNSLIYLAYLLLTHWGVAPKLAMTILYVSGTLATFLVNRAWTFQASGRQGALRRYVMAYAMGYLMNFCILVTLHDQLGMPHQLAQAIGIVVVAACLFLLMRAWVFAAHRTPDHLTPPSP